MIQRLSHRRKIREFHTLNLELWPTVSVFFILRRFKKEENRVINSKSIIWVWYDTVKTCGRTRVLKVNS